MKLSLHQRLAAVWMGLILLMLTSLGGAYLPLQGWNVALGMGIACLKAGMVLWCFMHFGRTSTPARLALAAGVFTVLVLSALSALEGATRASEPAAMQPPRQLPPLRDAAPLKRSTAARSPATTASSD
ncbi:cytochrome C oxidase subunit IV family protein [Roseateles sp.]|uniref:cytochrome C oxidase subunit IV family protein n=1 Tax=Roseateles sp. TaxID=1971397 RepID=UPI002E009E02|nr:cytochrome C oxidase subunit IV family protein [Roseateles sp.]HEV6965301.1 cytochrome C oxidase subunit IV family protein [Roseateles sp.]